MRNDCVGCVFGARYSGSRCFLRGGFSFGGVSWFVGLLFSEGSWLPVRWVVFGRGGGLLLRLFFLVLTLIPEGRMVGLGGWVVEWALGAVVGSISWG